MPSRSRTLTDPHPTGRDGERTCWARVLGPQINRVSQWLTRGGEEVGDPVPVFRSRGLLAPILNESVGEAAGPAGLTALGFAAAAFPNTAARLPETELRERIGAFVQVLTVLTPENDERSPADAVIDGLAAVGRFPEEFPRESISPLLVDLAGEEQDEAQLGAALHVATLTTEQVWRVVATWREESELVRFVRGSLLSPPSQLADANGRPAWDRLPAMLAKAFPDVPGAVIAGAVGLERDVWENASRVVGPGRAADAVAGFWDQIVRDRLRSGFPYFAFRSRFRTWWKQCVVTHPWDRPPAAVPEAEAAPQASNDPVDAEVNLLRVCREVYRVVRTTFYPRSADDPTSDNETYRRAVDAVWVRRLERVADDGGLPPDQFAAIRSDFPWLTEDTANNLSHRLRMRMVAGTKARVDRWRTAEILGLTRPGRMRTEPAVRVIATVCRSALPSETLIGAFLAHTVLYPRIRPQRPDPVTFAGIARELAVWVGANGFRAAVTESARQGSRLASAIEEVLVTTGPFGDFARSLARWEPKASADHEATATEWLAALLGPVGIASAAAPELRRRAASAGTHWAVPVWFLTVVERRPPGWVTNRLLPDEEEAPRVAVLARELTIGGPL